MAVVFFLEKGLPSEKIKMIENKLKEYKEVKIIEVITPEKALAKFKMKFPELRGIVDNLAGNPFPASIEVTLKENIISSEAKKFLEETGKIEGIEDVQYSREWVEKMESLSRVSTAVGFFLGGILILASFFIISNVIKLNVIARREEIEILRLIGAKNSFIRIPFLLEGIVLGTAGGLLALLLLFVLITLFPLYLGASLGALQEILSFEYLTLSQSMILLVGGALIGFFGSLTSLSRFLKI